MKKRFFRWLVPFICGVAIWWLGALCCSYTLSLMFHGHTLPSPDAGYLAEILGAVLFLAGVVGYYGVKITTLLKDIRDGKTGDDLDDDDEDDDEDDGDNLN